jgi:hypothetical protein
MLGLPPWVALWLTASLPDCLSTASLADWLSAWLAGSLPDWLSAWLAGSLPDWLSVWLLLAV